MLVLKNVHVKSVTANVAKGTISISFIVEKTDESLRTAESLAFFVDKGQVTLMVENRQMTFDEKKEGE